MLAQFLMNFRFSAHFRVRFAAPKLLFARQRLFQNLQKLILWHAAHFFGPG